MDETLDKKAYNESIIRKKKKHNHQANESHQNHCSETVKESEHSKRNPELNFDDLENENIAGEHQPLLKYGCIKNLFFCNFIFYDFV